MADHDGHTVNVGPVSVGKTLPKADPIDTDILRSAVWLRSDGAAHATLALCDEVDRLRMVEVVTLNYEREQIDAHRRRQEAEAEAGRLRAENAALRDLLAKALPWIDPNDTHEDFLLTVAIREALGEGA